MACAQKRAKFGLGRERPSTVPMHRLLRPCPRPAGAGGLKTWHRSRGVIRAGLPALFLAPPDMEILQASGRAVYAQRFERRGHDAGRTSRNCQCRLCRGRFPVKACHQRNRAVCQLGRRIRLRRFAMADATTPQPLWVHGTPPPMQMDLGEPSPRAIFTAVIYGDNRSKFGTPRLRSAARASV